METMMQRNFDHGKSLVDFIFLHNGGSVMLVFCLFCFFGRESWREAAEGFPETRGSSLPSTSVSATSGETPNFTPGLLTMMRSVLKV